MRMPKNTYQGRLRALAQAALIALGSRCETFFFLSLTLASMEAITDCSLLKNGAFLGESPPLDV